MAVCDSSKFFRRVIQEMHKFTNLICRMVSMRGDITRYRWYISLLGLSGCVQSFNMSPISVNQPIRQEAAELSLNASENSDEVKFGAENGRKLHSNIRDTGLSSIAEVASELSIPSELSIERAVIEAVTRNPDLISQALSPVQEGVFSAIERGKFDPTLYTNGSYATERASEVNRGTREQYEFNVQDTQVELGVQQKLPTGTDIEASIRHRLVEQSRLDPANESPSSALSQSSARIGITIVQSLLRGLGPSVQLAAVRQADMELEASYHELRGYVQAVLSRVEKTYWEHKVSIREVEILTHSFQVAEDELQDAQRRIQAGLLPVMEEAAARAEVALRKQALIDARSRETLSSLELTQILSYPLDASPERWNLISELEKEPLRIKDIAERCVLALQKRPELQEAKLQRAQNQLDTVVTRNGLLPQLDAFLSMGKTGFEVSNDSYIGRIGGAFSNLDTNTYDIRAGLELSHVLGSRVSRAQLKASRASVRQAELAIKNLEQLIKFQVRSGVLEVQRTLQQIDASRVTLASRDAAVEAERARFNAGDSTTLQLARVQRDRLASQLDVLRAQADYRRALIELYLAEGTYLDRRGINVADYSNRQLN